MTDKKIDRISGSAGAGIDTPVANVLTPDVRSGSTFSFASTENAQTMKAPVLVIWAFSLTDKSKEGFEAFKNDVADYEDTGPMPNDANLQYRGTYAASVSSISPDFEYRTIWALKDLSHIKTLNDVLRNSAGTGLDSILDHIDRTKPMRTEIIGGVGQAASH